MKVANKSPVNLTVQTDPKVPTPSTEPELLWINTDTTKSCLWPIKNDHNKSKGIDEFLESLMSTSDRIWILDPHFEGVGGMEIIHEYLFWAIEQAQERGTKGRPFDVRILTKRYKELRSWMNINSKSDERIKFLSADSIDFHDRYALLDHELWHFGSTVGGGYHGLSSATRGWYNHSSDFVDLFRAYWKKMS